MSGVGGTHPLATPQTYPPRRELVPEIPTLSWKRPEIPPPFSCEQNNRHCANISSCRCCPETRKRYNRIAAPFCITFITIATVVAVRSCFYVSLSDILFTKGVYTPWADSPPPETATAADGTYLTGMHSCRRLITHPSSDFK